MLLMPVRWRSNVQQKQQQTNKTRHRKNKKCQKVDYRSLLTTGTKKPDPNRLKKIVRVVNLLNVCSVGPWCIVYNVYKVCRTHDNVRKVFFSFCRYMHLYMSIGYQLHLAE